MRKDYHITLANYFQSKPLYLDGEEYKKPNVRKLVEQPWQETKAKQWDEVEKTLCNLFFLEAKVNASLIFDLMEDYNIALDLLPEAQNLKRERISHDEGLEEYTDNLIAFAKGEMKQLKIIKSVTPWSEKKISKERERMIHNPNRIDRLNIFLKFLISEQHIIEEFSKSSRFLIQHAYNCTNTGPVGIAAESIIESDAKNIYLIKLPSFRPDFNPFPEQMITLAGHNITVMDIDITPNYKFAITRSDNKILILWNLQFGKLISKFKMEDEEPSPGGYLPGDVVSISPDGRLMLSGGSGRIYVWDLIKRVCIRKIKDYLKYTSNIPMTADGKFAISTNVDGQILVWNISKGNCIKKLDGHTDLINYLCISANGKYIVSASDDKTIRLWDMPNSQCLSIFTDHASKVNCLSITPEGKWMVSGSDDGTVRFWDLEQRFCLKTFSGHKFKVSSVSITADGKIAASGSWDGTIRVYNLQERKCIKVIDSVGLEVVTAVKLTPDGRVLFSCVGQNITVWDIEHNLNSNLQIIEKKCDFDSTTKKENRQVDSFREKIITYNLHPIEDNEKQESLLFTNLISKRSIKVANVFFRFYKKLEISPDGRYILSGNEDGSAILISDLETGKHLKILFGLEKYQPDLRNLRFSPDGKWVLANSENGNDGFLWDIRPAYFRIKPIVLHDFKNGIFSLCGRFIIGNDRNRNLIIINFDKRGTGLYIKKHIRGHFYGFSIIYTSLDGNWAVSIHGVQYLSFWDLKNGKHILDFFEPKGIDKISFNTGCNKLVLKTRTKETITLSIRNMISGNPIVTAIQKWIFGDDFNCGHWDKNVIYNCPYCNHKNNVSNGILSKIQRIHTEQNIIQPTFSLSEYKTWNNWNKIWNEPGLLSECPKCKEKLKFNPFIAGGEEY